MTSTPPASRTPARRRARAAILATAATAITGLVGGGIAYAATASTPTASKTDTIVTTASNESLSATGQVKTTIASLNLPPGAYVLHASGDLVNFGPSDFTRCGIFVAGTNVAGVSTLVGNPSASGAQGAAGLLSSFALVGGAVNATTSNQLAVLACEHDDTNGARPYVDSSATLWAHKTGGLTLVRK
jgi:hypothetical protein